MTNELANVPELRFPEYSEEWEKKRLKDISKINPKLMNEFPSEFDYIDLESVYKGKINKVSRVTNENAPSRAQRVAQRGDVFFQTVRPYQQNNFVFLDDRYSTVVSTGYAQIRSNMNSFYIYNLLLTSTFLNKVLINCTGSNYPAINSNDLGNISIRISTNENEKQKIGDFFSKLDRQIELEEQKLSLLEEQKKGYMQKIFSQELRFKDENGNDYPNWIFEELNNIFTKYQNTIYLHDNEEYKRISISNKGKITHRDITFGKRIGRKRQYLIDLKKHPNTLTFIRQGVFLGGIGFIPSSLDGYIVTENMPLLSMSEEYSKKFMTYLFSSESYYKSVIFKNLPTGSAQKALHEKDWLKSFVNIPVYSEQEKIGNFFEKQDNLIKKQSDKVELLKERKKGFLQKMFV